MQYGPGASIFNHSPFNKFRMTLTIKCSTKEGIELAIKHFPELQDKEVVEYFNWRTLSFWFKVTSR